MLKSKARSEQIFIETQNSDGLTVISWGLITPESACIPEALGEINAWGTEHHAIRGEEGHSYRRPNCRDAVTVPHHPHRLTRPGAANPWKRVLRVLSTMGCH